MLYDGDLARQPIERGFIELTFAVGLFGLRFRTIKIAHHFGDRDDISRIDLGFIFLGPPGPHRALDTCAAFEGFQCPLDQRRLRQLAHADIGDLGGRHPQRHLILHEIDHEQLKLGAGDFLIFDRENLANAVRGINHEFVGLEALTLGQNLFRFLDARRNGHDFRGGLACSDRLVGNRLCRLPWEASWRKQPSKQWPSNRSLSRQFLQSCLALRFFCFSRTLQPRPWWLSGHPLRKPGHDFWLHRGWPPRLFWNPWKHSFYAFSVTRPARGTSTPLFDVFAASPEPRYARLGSACNVPNIAHFPQKSMI